MIKKISMFVLLIISFPLFVNAEVFTEVSNKEELVESIINGESVKLTSNIDISDVGLVIPSDAVVTIDLNGYSISVISEYNQNIRVSEYASLTVMDSSGGGKIYSFGPVQNNGRGVIDVNGTFILESGTIEALLDSQSTGTNVNAIVVSKENSTAEFNEDYTAKVIINGGVINSTSSAITNHNSFGGNTKIIVNGGEINSVYYGIYSYYTSGSIPAEHDIEINGGVFNTGLEVITIASSDFAYSDETHNKNVVPDLTITGGTFNTSEGYSAIKFNLYNYSEVTTDDISKYFDVEISGAKFSNDPSEYKSFFIGGWYLETELTNNYYVMSKISLDETLYEEPSSVDKPTVFIKNLDSVNSVIFESIAYDNEITNLLLESSSTPSVEIQINEEETLSDSVVNEMKKLINDGEIITYFNISVLLTIDDFEKNLENLTEEIELTIKMPADFIDYNDNVTRTFYVIREHDGVVEKLETSLDGDELSFKTDKFSSYALAYEDVINPDTSDKILIYISLLGIAVVGIFAVFKLKSKK